MVEVNLSFRWLSPTARNLVVALKLLQMNPLLLPALHVLADVAIICQEQPLFSIPLSP